MKHEYLLLFALFLIFYVEPNRKHMGQTVVDGKVSVVEIGVIEGIGSASKIRVQNSTSTQEVKIPFELDGRWKVGDSCLLIIEKYEIVKEK